MARWIVAGLVVVNLLLGLGVWMRLGGERTAKADIGKPEAQFVAVSGPSNNMPILYMLDVNTGSLVALQINPIQGGIKQVAKADVTSDLSRIR